MNYGSLFRFPFGFTILGVAMNSDSANELRRRRPTTADGNPETDSQRIGRPLTEEEEQENVRQYRLYIAYLPSWIHILLATVYMLLSIGSFMLLNFNPDTRLCFDMVHHMLPTTSQGSTHIGPLP